MCAIFGVYSFKGKRIDEERIKRAATLLSHRGPDEDGIYIDKRIGLAHKRLKIIDLERGQQPMECADKSAVIILNGEIYNFKKLREELQKKGYKFSTSSDTEVLLYLLKEEMVDALEKLNGMFAFAFYDKEKNLLLLARDRVGIKPLYYYIDEEELIFSSEMKAILEYLGKKLPIDYEALDKYFSFGYIKGPKTIYKGIKKLPPATYMLVEESEVKIKKYYDFKIQEEEKDEEAFLEELEALLKDSIRLHLVSDVPVGVFLSGGIDSSFIAALAKREKEDIEAFTIKFKGGWFDESEYAKTVASYIKCKHHIIDAEFKHLSALLPKVIWHHDEPFSDPASLPTYIMSEYVKRYITVVLTGEGGDEAFAGYDTIYNVILYEEERFPWKKDIEELDAQLRLLSLRQLISEELKDVLYSDRLKEALKEHIMIEQIEPHFSATKGAQLLNRLIYYDVKVSLPDYLLMKVDRNTMAVGLEARVPYLDHRVLELSFKMPACLKLKGRENKYIFKRLAQKYLPPSIVHREKHGFTPPLSEWLLENYSFVKGSFFRARKVAEKLFNTDVLNKIIERFYAKDVSFTYPLWLLLVFMLWYREFEKYIDPDA